MTRIPALDGLRAVSILLVVCSHVLETIEIKWLPGGLGVTVFFFISGFIITKLLFAESRSASGLDLTTFYIKRIFRLAPALLVYVAVAALVFQALGVTLTPASISASVFYYANYYNIYTIASPVEPPVVGPPLAVLWSLAVEEHFYFIYPFVLAACFGKPVLFMRCLLVFLVASLAWRTFLVAWFGLDTLPINRILMATDTRLDSIVYGCLLAVMMDRAHKLDGHRIKRLLDAASSRAAQAFGVALLLFTLAIREPEFRETLRYSLQGIALMVLFTALFWPSPSNPRRLERLLTQRWMLYVGAISYSLYMYHFLVMRALQLFFGNSHTEWRLLATALLAFVLASMSYHFVETPFRRFGARLVHQLRPLRAA